MTVFRGIAKQRLDKFLVEVLPHLSRASIQKMVRSGKVLVNGVVARAAYFLSDGDVVTVPDVSEKVISLNAENLDLEVLYEDSDCMVVNKPAGMVIHPDESGRNMSGTVANFALSRVGEAVGGELRPGIVHRLDRDTSGVLLLAKTAEAFDCLQSQFRDRQVEKVYLTLVKGILRHREGVVDSPIGRNVVDKRKMGIVSGGRQAVSTYRVLKEIDDVSLVEVRILTGRTHQIRVHMAAIGHPVVGDAVYGDKCLNMKFRERLGLKRQFLHAWKIVFRLPSTNEKVRVRSRLPDDLDEVLKHVPNLWNL